ncbi:CaiB/BaiF CoA transferase family protein [Pacificimonas pallii]|nr:CaiB/BaiF CoA-transferase family protein [Pacificimonas pallii]
MKVLDLSRVLAGPWCTMILADLGAEIIKIENPNGGDDTRRWGPPYVGTESAYYLCANRNKKSVAIDISTAEGQEIVRTLAAGADVLVENYKLGGLEKFGLGYKALSALNPRLIYCSISGYGRQSPLAARPGYDYVIQAEGGLMSVTGPADGEPMKVGVAVADLYTGMAAAQAVLAAIVAQQRDGTGQHIDMALFDAQLAMLANVGAAYLATGEDPPRLGNQHPTVVPYQVFATSDGSAVVAVGNDRQFAALCKGPLARPELAADERFQTNAARVRNRKALIPLLAARIAEEPTAFWLEAMRANGTPCGEVRSVGAALTSPEAMARQMVRQVQHPTEGEIGLVASPLKLGATPVVTPAAPPLLGQHTDEVLAALPGHDEASILDLRERGIVA